MQPVPEEEPEEVKAAPADGDGDDDGDAAPADDGAGDDDDDDPDKKKKKVIEPPVAPLLVGRPEPSTKDTMIELKTNALIPNSSTMLAVSCFNSQQVLICNVDIKTRGRTIKGKIHNEQNPQSPTQLYQIDEIHLLVGTLAGKFEIWNIDPEEEKPTIKQVFDAHPGSEKGVSQILELQNPSAMILGDARDANDYKYLVSTAADKEEILIWKLKVNPNAS